MTRPDDRDTERLLRGPLAETPAATDGCLDAETLAAWTDGGLTPDARAAAESHASSCARCQMLLAAMAVTIPSTAASAPAPSWWRVGRWLVPAMAASLAVALWVRTPESGPSLPAAVSTSASRAATEAAPPAKPAASPVAPEAPRTEGRTQAPQRSRTPAMAPNVDRENKAIASESAAKDDSRQAGRGGAARYDALAPMPAPIATPSAPTEVTAAASPPPQPPPRGGVAGAAQSLAESATLAARRVPSPALVIPSPDPVFQWRALADGDVERSINGGATWQRQATGAGSAITAGASSSAFVCWFVGPRGLVLLTIDGRTWRHVPVPGAPDLVAVRAIDSRRAVVTTADGRSLLTEDGGASWVPRVP